MGNSNNDKELNDAYNNPDVSTSDLLNMISGRMNKQNKEVATVISVTPENVQMYIDEYNKAKTVEQKSNVLQAAKAAGIEVATIKVDDQVKSIPNKEVNDNKQREEDDNEER